MSNTLRLVRNLTSLDNVVYSPSTEDSEFPAENLRDPLRSKVWRTTSVSAQEIIFDLQTSEEVDSIAVFFRLNQAVRLTGSATVRIQGNASTNFAAPLYSQDLTLDDDNLVISHFLSTAEEHRYWRLYLDDPSNPYGGFEISQIVLGKSEVLDGAARGFKWSNIDASRTQRTAFGQKYSDILPSRKRFEFELPVEEFSTFERMIDFYEQVGKHEAFMCSLDPLETIWGEKDRFLIWGTFEDNFSATDVPSVYFTMPFKIEEQG